MDSPLPIRTVSAELAYGELGVEADAFGEYGVVEPGPALVGP